MRKWTNVAFLTAGLLLLMLGGGIGRGMGALERATMGPLRHISREVAWTWMAAQLSYAAAILVLSWLAFAWRPARWVGAVIGIVGILTMLFFPLFISDLLSVEVANEIAKLFLIFLAGGYRGIAQIGAAVLTVLGGWIALGGSGRNSEDEKNP